MLYPHVLCKVFNDQLPLINHDYGLGQDKQNFTTQSLFLLICILIFLQETISEQNGNIVHSNHRSWQGFVSRVLGYKQGGLTK